MDIIIDGVVAQRNVPSKSTQPVTIPGFPAQAEMKRIWLAGWRMSQREIVKRYGTCPGMDAWIYETIAGNWRPVEPNAPLANGLTAPNGLR